MLKKTYQKYVKGVLPCFIRELITESASIFSIKGRKNRKLKEALKNSVLNNFNEEKATEEECEIVNYLRFNKYSLYPFEWSKEYLKRKIKIIFDRNNKMHYVLWNEQKLYFHKEHTKKDTRNGFNFSAMEMDLLSPHRYVTAENYIIGTIERNTVVDEPPFYVKEGDVVADIGASHGNFSISVVDIASHIYIFECEEKWCLALEKTFENYKEKVTIIKKYVSNEDSETSVRLDSFFANKEVNFIKADIEGYENKMLEGANELIKNSENLKVSICVYHKPNDDIAFKKYFEEKGYNTYFTKGLIFPTFLNSPLSKYNKNSNKFFRKVILRAYKNNI